MNQETQNSLQTLEQELQRLRAAVDHIDQAKGIAQKVLVAVAGVQKKYAEHLDALLELHKSTVEHLGADSHSRFDEVGAAARRHILESAARAKKLFEEQQAEMQSALNEAGETASVRLADLSARAEQLLTHAGESIRKAVSDAGSTAAEHVSTLGFQVQKLIEELGADANRLLEDSGRNAGAQLESHSAKAGHLLEDFGATARSQVMELGARAHKHIEELGGKSSAGVERISALAESGVKDALTEAKHALEETNAHSIKVFAAIKKSYDQHTLEFEKLSSSTDGVIASAAKLVRAIDAIDFPEKLHAIQTDIRGLHSNLNSAISRTDALDKSMGKSLRELADDIVGKIGRLEMFTEKIVRTLGEETEHRLRDQQEEIKRTRILVIIMLVLNVVIIAGLFMLWSREPAPVVQPPAQTTVDTTDTSLPVEAETEPARRKNR